MAIVRTVLPRKGFIEPQHGLTQYEADMDANMSLLDANVAFMSDLSVGTLNINGVVSGFTLSTSSSLTPGLTAGKLFAQGVCYNPSAAPSPGAAPTSATNYLFYNSGSGFYYQASAVGANAGDALIGLVTTSPTAVTAITQGTMIFGSISLSPSAPGNFTVPHLLGRTPLCAVFQKTSAGDIWFRSGTKYDGTNLYLVASAAGVTATVVIW